MKMNVKFETTEQVFNVGFSKRGKTFSTSVKDVVDLTEGQKEIAYQGGYTEGHATGYEIGRADGYEQGASDAAFIAVYNQTTFDEVIAAIEQGKVVFARSGKTYYALTNYETTIIRFSRAYQSTTSHLTLSSADKWASGSTTHAKSTHTHTSDDITFTDDTKEELAEYVKSTLPIYDGSVVIV